MNTIKFKCHYCGKETDKYVGHVNRARKLNAPLYCDKKCAGLGRRTNETEEEKKVYKQWYDLFIRASKTDEERILAKINKQLLFHLDYRANPEKYREERRRKMPAHVEYCRQPKYKEYKRRYDEQYHAKNNYGDWWEAAIALKNLENEVDGREAFKQNKLYNKNTKTRKRLWVKQLKQNVKNLQQLTLKTSFGTH